MSVSSGEEPHSHRYISVPKAVQLIPKFFNGNPLELREFIQNVESAYEVVDPLDYSLLLKFVQAKIGGEAETKLLARTHIPGNRYEPCWKRTIALGEHLTIMHTALSLVNKTR
jgi:hypothetical protein